MANSVGGPFTEIHGGPGSGTLPRNVAAAAPLKNKWGTWDAARGSSSQPRSCVCVLGGRWKGSGPLLHSLTWLGPARSVISTNTNHVAGPMPAHLLHTGATGSSTVHLPAIRFGPEYPAESDGAPPTPAPSPDRSQTWQRLRLCYVCQYECLTWFNQQQNFEKINVVLT